ncbi:MAG TPA: M48 family metalloprotease [Bryobacteraceae bacterium]
MSRKFLQEFQAMISNRNFISLPTLRQLLMTAGTVLLSFTAFGQVTAPPSDLTSSAPARVAHSADQAVDFAIASENALDQKLREMQPVVETYIQQMQPDEALGAVPKADNYFLGRLDLSRGVSDDSFIPLPGGWGHTLSSLASLGKLGNAQFMARGFAQMVVMDDGGFNKGNYNFQYLRREFLGDVRCIVYQVTPKKEAGRGRFIGRMWVEDRDYNIVRFNGTYTSAARDNQYVHFDSWRVNTGANLWLPAFIYSEEGIVQASAHKLSFKAQTRLWAYQSQKDREREEFTNITVDTPQGVDDKSAQAADAAPVESMRMWQHEAEDNLLDRLQAAGILAPRGDVDKVLQTVLDNLEITNKINVQPEVRVRVMMTTPMESVYVGHTIVVSRGMIDVLPDEASLAAVIAHQLGHILLGHQLDTGFAFGDRVIFNDDQTLRKVDLARSESEEEAADKKALELLKNSPYNAKLANVGLFLRTLSARSQELPHLLQPLLGNGMEAGAGDIRMGSLMANAPELKLESITQISALPLGTRVKIDPWSSRLTLVKSHGVALLSATEKKPLEITPLMIHLTRQPTSEVPASNQAAANLSAPQETASSSIR